jgi:hypothetical protein
MVSEVIIGEWCKRHALVARRCARSAIGEVTKRTPPWGSGKAYAIEIPGAAKNTDVRNAAERRYGSFCARVEVLKRGT